LFSNTQLSLARIDVTVANKVRKSWRRREIRRRHDRFRHRDERRLHLLSWALISSLAPISLWL